MTYFDAQTEIRRENEEAKAPVDSMVILDHLAYLAYHLYTLDALSRCTYPLRWGVLRADLRAEFMERAAIAYRMWHDSECESRADWEVLEKLEADTLRFMVVDLQSGIERMDVAQRKELEEANKSLDEYRACVDKWRLWYDNASEDAKKWRRDAQDFYGALVKIAEYHGTKDEVWANNMRTIAKEALADRP